MENKVYTETISAEHENSKWKIEETEVETETVPEQLNKSDQ